MKLSKQLKQDDASGDFGNALNGYSDRALRLEEIVLRSFYDEAVAWGADHDKAKEYADKRLEEI